jgi:ArsR family transcriptional regulator
MQKMVLFEKQAEVFKALSQPYRIAIVDFLRNGEQCVCDIAEHIGAERSNVSRHLSLMVSVNLLSSRKNGLKVMYALKMPCVLTFFSCVTDSLKQQADKNAKLLKEAVK